METLKIPSFKIYTQCGLGFGDHQHAIAVIVRALYGLTTSAEQFRTILADAIHMLVFKPTRFDRDV